MMPRIIVKALRKRNETGLGVCPSHPSLWQAWRRAGSSLVSHGG